MSSPSAQVQLDVRIHREEGMFTSECDSPKICTWAKSLEDVLAGTVQMFVDYFEASRELGTLSATLEPFGVSAPTPDHLELCIRAVVSDVPAELRTEQHVRLALAS